jgi:hypothetical protein
MKPPKAPQLAQPPSPGFIPLKGKSGTLYGFIDPARRVIEFKRKGLAPETIDLADYFKA